MGIAANHFLIFFILIEFVSIGNFVNHYSITEEENEATASIGQILVALSQEGNLPAQPKTPCFDIHNFAEPSLQGRELLAPSPGQDDRIKSAMEMCLLHETQQDERFEMWKMRHHVASMLRYVLCSWRQIQEGGLDLCELGRRRAHMGCRNFYKESFQIAAQDKEGIHAKDHSTQSQRGACAPNGSTMECQATASSPCNDTVDREHRECSSGAATTNIGAEAAEQRANTVAARDPADHRRVYIEDWDFQEHAPGSQEGRSSSGKTQGGSRSSKETACSLAELRGGKYQTLASFRGGFRDERCCLGQGGQCGTRRSSGSKKPPRRSERDPLQNGRRCTGHRDHLRWGAGRRCHEGGHCRSHTEKHLLCGGQSEAAERPTSGGSIRRSSFGQKSTHRRFWAGIASAFAFPRAGQIDLAEVCPRPSSPLCFHDQTLIWNHSFVDDADFITPWEASIDAVDLSYEVGTNDMRPSCRIVECMKRPLKRRVQFHSRVDLYVGAEEDFDMAHWTHKVGVPCQLSCLLHPKQSFSGPPFVLHDLSASYDETDEMSFLAAQAVQGGPHPGLPNDGPNDAIMNDRNIAREFDDISPVSTVSSPAISTSSERAAEEVDDWYVTMIFTVEGGPGNLWLNWNDYMDMHQKVASALRIEPSDLYNMHIVATPPQDVDRAHTGVVIANRRGDLPTGSTECFVLLDVEFHSAVLLAMPEVVRKARLIPDAISRNQLLRGLGLHPFCAKAANRCLIWVNDELIPLGTQRVHLHDGDYVRIAVPPGGPDIDHIDTRCLATAFHQGMTVEDISMRHTLFRLGWHDEVVGPPHVPRNRRFHGQEDGDGALFLQIHRIKLPALDVPDFLYDWEPHARIPEEPPHRCEASPTFQVAAPGMFQGIEAEPAVIQELYMHWLAHIAGEEAATGIDETVLHVDSWYLDMPRFLSCEQSRPVALQQNFVTWFQAFADAWNDLLDPMWPIDLHVVRPTPPATATQRTRKIQVIVTQQLPHDGVANLFTIIRTGPQQRPVRHVARFAPRQVTKPQVIGFAGLAEDCYPELSSLQCMVWHGDLQIEGQIALRNRNGVGFVIIIEHLPHLQRRAQAIETTSVWENDDDNSLLQIQSSKRTLYLNELIPATTAVRLLDCTAKRSLPNPLEISMPGTAHQVSIELQSWGHRCQVFPCHAYNVMLCIDLEREAGDDEIPVYNYQFCHDDPSDEHGCFAHSSQQKLTEIQIMSLLYNLGYQRAVILQLDSLNEEWTQVLFHHREPQVQPRGGHHREQSEWPKRSSYHRTSRPLFDLEAVAHLEATCRLCTAFDVADFKQLFDSIDEVLCHDLTGLHLPEECQAQLQDLDIRPLNRVQDLDQYDRLLIFTDGSSRPAMRRLAPQHADSLGCPDTWAMVVVGEIYQSDTTSTTHLLGWTTQPVTYNQEGSAFFGIQRTGSDVAERAGLIAAAMWRIACNHAIPTTFCTDSAIGLGQADGSLGTAWPEESFYLLRSLFQALEAALEPGALQVAHTRAHAGALFNEIADTAAKMEAKQSFHHKRQLLDLGQWKHKFAHLWTFFGHKYGLPPWCDGGMDVSPPALPAPRESDDQQRITHWKHKVAQFGFSIGSANVQSLYKGPLGHAGKLHYLQEQMRHYMFNCLVLQETRSEQGLSHNGNILRFCSGHQGGHYGIEIWIDLEVPYAHLPGGKGLYFQRQHFTIVHQDPRRLLLRCDAGDWSFWLLALHAPHSGYAATYRTDWWTETIDIVDQRYDGDVIFLAGDANAEPGPADYRIVCREGFPSSANTEAFRQLLQHFDLHLPATGAAHTGENGTWTNFSGTQSHCIDHIAIPGNWALRCTHSCVVDDFDLGNTHEDHSLVAVQLQWQDSVWTMTRSSAKRRLSVPQKRTIDLQQAVGDFIPLPWEADIERQAQHAAQHLRQALGDEGSAENYGKKPYVSHEIWRLRQQKLAHRKKLKEQRQHCKHQLLLKCFRAWKTRQEDEHADLIFNYGTTCICRNLHTLVLYKRASKKLRFKLTTAKQTQLTATLDNLDSSMPASSVLRALRSFTGPTNPKKLKKANLPIVSDEQGMVCGLPNDALAVWVRYFQDMEAGERMSMQKIRQQWIMELQQFAQPSLEAHFADLPSLTDLELALRRVARGKACGPDGIPGEVYRFFPVPIARLLYSQLIKLTLHGQEDLAAKGGIVAPIYKGRGPIDQCSSYRSILVSNHMSKAIHRTIRQKHMVLYEHFLQTQQKGGRRKTPVQLAMHQTRAFVRQAKQAGRSASIVYLDLTEAFYRIIREVPIGGCPSDELVAHIMTKLRMPPDALHQIHELLAETPALEQAGMREMDQRCVRALHTGTHFWLKNQIDVVRTNAGTRPGDCFADFIFSFAWSCVLKKLESYMTETNAIVFFEEQTGLPLFGQLCGLGTWAPFLGPTWMDDLAVCLQADRPTDLVSMTGHVTGKLIDLCHYHCMTPNLAKGKTEIMMIFRGTGSRKAKVEFYGPQSPGTLPVLGENSVHHVQLVSAYRHLGGLLHHTGDQHAEIRRRTGIAHQAFNQNRKVIFQNSKIEISKRCELFEMLVLSKYLYGADTWIAMDSRTMNKFHASILKLYRRLMGKRDQWQTSDEEVLDALRLPCPEDLLRRARLRYLCTLVQMMQPDIWALLAKDAEWMGLLEQDIIWMWTQLNNSSGLPDPRANIEYWQNLILYSPGYWKRLVRRATQHSILQRSRSYRVRLAHRQALDRMRLMLIDAPSSSAFGDADEKETQAYGCMGCGLRCASKAGEAAHMHKAHGQSSSLRPLFDEPTCPACLRHYHTMSKMKAHLYYSTACRNQLRAWGLQCGPVPGAGSREDCEREVAHDRLLPPLSGQGPHNEPRPPRHFVDIDDGTYDLIVAALEEHCTLEVLHDQIKTHVSGLALSWTRFQGTLQYFQEHFDQQDAVFFGYDLEQLQAFLTRLGSEASWPFLQKGVCKTPHLPSLQQLEDECRRLEDFLEQHPDRVQQVPRVFGKHRVVLHAFSGRRRRGDVQFFLDLLAEKQDMYSLHVVSMDVIVNREWGDATCSSTCEFWWRAIQQRHVIAFIGGPPCETWSQARGQRVETDFKHDKHDAEEPEVACGAASGPRVIRTILELWGMGSVSLRELRQLCVGNDLLFFSILCIIALIEVDGFAIMEHPAEPAIETSASIWRTALVRALMAFPQVQCLRFAQGLLGAKTPKPTNLLTVNLPRMLFHLHQGRICKELPTSTAIGRTESGVWRTTALKEYPPALCRCMAVALIEVFDQTPVASHAQEPSREFVARCQEMVMTSFGDEIGADYAFS